MWQGMNMSFFSRKRMGLSRDPLSSMFASSRSLVLALYKKRNQEVVSRQNVVNKILSAIDHETSYEGALDRLQPLNVRLTSLIVTRILRTAHLDVDVLWSFFSWTRTKGFKHDKDSYFLIVKKLKKGHRLDPMKQILADMQSDGYNIPLPIYRDVINELARSRNVEAVKETWSDMKLSGSKPDVSCFNIVLKLLMEERKYHEGLHFYKDMLQSRCCPDANTYHILIKSLVNIDKLAAAHMIMKKMPGFGIQPFAITFDEMVKASLKAGDLDMVTELLLEMKETHREPKESTMFQVRNAFGRAGKSMDILKQELPTYFDSEDPGIAEPSTCEQGYTYETRQDKDYEVSYNFRPSLLHRIQAWGPSAIKFLEEWDFKWNASSACNLLNGLHLDAAFGFFQWLKEQDGYIHDQKIYNKMIMLLLTSRRYEDIERLLDEMICLGFSLETWVLNNVLESYGSNHDALGALTLYKKVTELGSEPNSITFTCLIGILMRNQFYQQAMDVYATMLQSGFQPNCLTYSVLIHGLGIAGKAEAGHKLLNIMLKHGYKPNVITYTALMGAYTRINDISKVMELYQKMQDTGIEPTPVTFKVLAKALHRAGDVEAARETEDKLHSLIFSRIGESVMEKTRESICNELLNSLEVIVGSSGLSGSS